MEEQKKEVEINPLTGRKREFPNAIHTGRVRGSKNRRKTILEKLKKDPAHELITIAHLLRQNPGELERKSLEAEMKIWLELLEHQRAKKRAISEKEQTQAGSKKAAETTFELLQKLEKEAENVDTRTAGTSNTPSLDNGQPSLQTETSSEEDLQNNQEE